MCVSRLIIMIKCVTITCIYFKPQAKNAVNWGMSEITDPEEQKVVQDFKREILEELFGPVHEYADGKLLWPSGVCLALHD